MSAIKKSISMPEDIWERADIRRKELGYTTMSAYLQHLARQDLMQQGEHVRRVEKEGEHRYAMNETSSAPHPLSTEAIASAVYPKGKGKRTKKPSPTP